MVEFNCCLKYLQNVYSTIHHWNKNLLFTLLHGNKGQEINLVLAKYSSLVGWPNYWFSLLCVTQERKISAVTWSRVIVCCWQLCKTVASQAILCSWRKDKFAQSFRIDTKMFQSNEGQMWWIHELGGTIINKTAIVLLKAFFFFLVICEMIIHLTINIILESV